jgi:hypothetical protein
MFLKDVVVDVLRDFSKLELYGLVEADRKRFDFSCGIERDWTRPLVRQVLWKNERGIDKDLRLLLSDETSEVKVYVVRDNAANRLALDEVLQDFGAPPLGKICSGSVSYGRLRGSIPMMRVIGIS